MLRSKLKMPSSRERSEKTSTSAKLCLKNKLIKLQLQAKTKTWMSSSASFALNWFLWHSSADSVKIRSVAESATKNARTALDASAVKNFKQKS